MRDKELNWNMNFNTPNALIKTFDIVIDDYLLNFYAARSIFQSSLKHNDFKQSHSKNILLTLQVIFMPDT